jgi:hypothetical protein
MKVVRELVWYLNGRRLLAAEDLRFLRAASPTLSRRSSSLNRTQRYRWKMRSTRTARTGTPRQSFIPASATAAPFARHPFACSRGRDALSAGACAVWDGAVEIVAVADLAGYSILGGGSSDLRSGFRELAADPSVDAAVVVTDGMITYPSEPMAFAVLWTLIGCCDGFAPPYGRVIRFEA